MPGVMHGFSRTVTPVPGPMTLVNTPEQKERTLLDVIRGLDGATSKWWSAIKRSFSWRSRRTGVPDPSRCGAPVAGL